MDRFCSKLVLFLMSVTFTGLDKHTSLLQNPYNKNLKRPILQSPKGQNLHPYLRAILFNQSLLKLVTCDSLVTILQRFLLARGLGY